MDYTLSAELQVRLPDEAYVYDLGSFYERVDGLADKRQARGKWYTLALIITLLVLAKLSGEDNPTAMADWAAITSGGRKIISRPCIAILSSIFNPQSLAPALVPCLWHKSSNWNDGLWTCI